MLSLKNKMRIFSALLLLCFLALGILVINKLEMVNSQSRIIATLWTPRLQAAAEMGIAAREYRISEALRIQSISEDMAEQSENDMKVNAGIFLSRLEAYRGLLKKNEASEKNRRN